MSESTSENDCARHDGDNDQASQDAKQPSNVTQTIVLGQNDGPAAGEGQETNDSQRDRTLVLNPNGEQSPAELLLGSVDGEQTLVLNLSNKDAGSGQGSENAPASPSSTLVLGEKIGGAESPTNPPQQESTAASNPQSDRQKILEETIPNWDNAAELFQWSPDSASADALPAAIHAARAGNAPLTRLYLEQALQADPENPASWLWFAWTSASPAAAVTALEQARQHGADSALLEHGLAWARGMQAFELAKTAADAAPESTEPAGDAGSDAVSVTTNLTLFDIKPLPPTGAEDHESDPAGVPDACESPFTDDAHVNEEVVADDEQPAEGIGSSGNELAAQAEPSTVGDEEHVESVQECETLITETSENQEHVDRPSEEKLESESDAHADDLADSVELICTEVSDFLEDDDLLADPEGESPADEPAEAETVDHR